MELYSYKYKNIIDTCFRNPLKVSFECSGKVFAHAQLSEGFPSLHAGSFVAELPAKEEHVGGELALVERKRIIVRVFVKSQRLAEI
jgi:hypothetical protein